MAYLWALLSSLSFGFSNIIVKKSLSEVSISKTIVVSTISSLFFLVLNILIFRIGVHPSAIQVGTAFLYALMELALYLTLFKSFEVGNVSIAAGIVSSYPLLTTLLAFVIWGQTIKLIGIGFIVIVVLGAILTGIDWESVKMNRLTKNDFVEGIGWMLLSMCVHALYFPLLDQFVSQGNWQVSLLLIKSWLSLMLIIVFVFIRREKVIPPKNLWFVTSLFGATEIIGWTGYILASVNTESSIIITALTSTASVFTAVLAFLLLREKLVLWQYVGIILMTIGVIGLTNIG